MLTWLSTFLFNPALAVGATAVASPILIHIFSRRRFRKVRWAAMEFLLDAQKRNRRRVRLEQLILLALRCLAVLLIALMVMRPFVRPSSAIALLGSAARTERVVLLDDSFSMLYRSTAGGGAGQSVFDQGRAATERLARWIAAEAEGDSLTLLLTSRPETVSLALPSLSEQNLAKLHDHLDSLAASHRPARMTDALAATAGLIRARPLQANTTVYVVTDVQRGDWIVPARPGEDKPRSPIAPLAELNDDKRTVRLGLIDVGVEGAGNVAVTDLAAAQPQAVAGVPARFDVAVANYTLNPLTDVEIADAVAAQSLPPVIVPRVPAGQTVRDAIEVTYPNDGSDYLKVSLAGAAAGDGLAIDNTRWVAAPVAAAVKVLIVDGEPNVDPYLDEVYLLRTALRPEGRAASGNDLTVIDDDQIESTDLSGYHVVILANALHVSEAGRRALEGFVRGGGGLAIFAGDQVDPDLYNQRFYDGGRGLLPLPIGKAQTAPAGSTAVGFAEWDATRPMLRAFTDSLASILKQVRVTTFVTVDESSATSAPTEGGNASGGAAASRPSSDASQRTPAAVIARYGDPQRSAALVERPFGQGRVLLVTTSVDQEWNDWAASFAYVPMMLEMVQHMARRSEGAAPTLVGAPLTIAAEEDRYAPVARLRTPGYPNDPEITLTPTAVEGGRKAFVYDGADRAGLYRFELTTKAGDATARYAAVNLDPAESNLARASRAELEDALPEMKFDYVRDLSVLSGESAGGRRELWWPILIGAVCVLMLEHGLAWWFGTRG